MVNLYHQIFWLLKWGGFPQSNLPKRVNILLLFLWMYSSCLSLVTAASDGGWAGAVRAERCTEAPHSGGRGAPPAHSRPWPSAVRDAQRGGRVLQGQHTAQPGGHVARQRAVRAETRACAETSANQLWCSGTYVITQLLLTLADCRTDIGIDPSVMALQPSCQTDSDQYRNRDQDR